MNLLKLGLEYNLIIEAFLQFYKDSLRSLTTMLKYLYFFLAL